MTIAMLDTPEQNTNVPERIGALMDRGSHQFETEHRRKDGTAISADVNARRIIWNYQPAMMCICRDITERKAMEDALRKSKQFLSATIDALSAHICVLDNTGTIIAVNRAWRDFAMANPPLPKNYLEGDNYLSVCDSATGNDAGEAKAFAAGLRAVMSGERKEFSMEYPCHSPTINRWFFGRVTRFSGKDTLSVVAHEDITERKRAEDERRSMQERLQRSEKMEALGQLAGGVAHDLNNVLGVSTIYSELLQDKFPEGDPARSYANNILSSNEKAAAIIQDLLTLARRGVAAAEVMDLNTVTANFLKSPVFEKIQAFHPNVFFRVECDEELMHIKGSPVHIEKTVMNLVLNAAEAISNKGEVTIKTENRYLDTPIRGYDEVKQGDYVVLTVSDTGMGIPAQNIGKIFEPFYTQKTMGRSGTGLGLTIVWGTVKDHNGYTDVQSEIGKGTTFTLYFPVTREELTAQKKKVPIEQYMGKGESVLVIDDIAEQRDIASTLLTRLGYQVHAVPSGEEAVSYLKENTADILVLDMIMPPGIDGLETYRRVLELNPKQKAILVSGFAETVRVKGAQKLGAGAYVKKPYLMEKIGVAIRDELNR